MALTASNILVCVAFLLALLGIIKPSWPLVPVSVLLICIVLLINVNK